MKIKKQEFSFKNLKSFDSMLLFSIFCFCFLPLLSYTTCWAVNSQITRHSTAIDLQQGKTENVVIDSRGTIQLGRETETIVEQFEDVWSINSIAVSGGSVFIGTSPNGGVYKYSLGKLTKIYPVDSDKKTKPQVDTNEPNEPNESQGQVVSQEEYLANEHIFALATDVSGRLLVGISGEDCKVMRLESGKMKTIYEPNDAKYIFAITVAENGNIYLGTGPEGKIYQLDSFGEKPKLIYDSPDKNILSIAVGKDGFVYAGSDSRGLVYKINARTKKTTVLYDSEQDEITALLFTQTGDLYAAATSAKLVRAQTKFAAQLPLAGRPDTISKRKGESAKDDGGLELKIANTKKTSSDKKTTIQPAMQKPASPAKASYIYKISRDGFVNEVFGKTAVLFSLVEYQQELLVGTGNNAQLFSIDPAAEEEKQVYADEEASQITALLSWGGNLYLGTANPAKLLKLNDRFTEEGVYNSSLVDAEQPAEWGKLQIEADIPKGCEVLVSSRSGNVKDINDPTFSEWTEYVSVTKPVQLQCPNGRFCQYKLILKSLDGQNSPVVREIAVASVVPNLAPKVESVTIDRAGGAPKKGFFNISYDAVDKNKDDLIYKIEFRKIGRESWIELKDKIETSAFEWDGKTVEDGRYEVKVTASDVRSNNTATMLTASRISDPVVVDNTPPTIKKFSITKNRKAATLKLQLSDKLSVIGKVHYTVDSNEDWISTVPDDLVYDTTDEDFTILTEELEPGEHIISVKAADDIGNTTYKTFEVNI